MGSILAVAVVLAVLISAASGTFDFGDCKFSPLARSILLCVILLVVSTLLSLVLWFPLLLCFEIRTAWYVAFFIVYGFFACLFEIGLYNSHKDDVKTGRCGRKEAFRTLGWHLLIPLIFLEAWFHVPNILWYYMDMFFGEI